MQAYAKTLLFGLILTLFAPTGFAQEKKAGSEELKGLQYRMIGPFRGGRVTAVTGLPQEIFTYFMGTTGGGLWKTEDGGTSWNNISDGYFKVASIGSVEVAPSDPNIIYVGTGSASPRGNISPGNGIYKSDDGGNTWQHLGLARAGQIGKLAIHPQNSELVYAAVLGNVFGASEERGVYRSKDGGKNWENVHYVNDRTGAIDLVMDPNNPRILYAGMWTAERKPWTMIDGSEESRVWKSTDGGENWKKLGEGLPHGPAGRIGIAVSSVNSQRVWVIQEAKDEKQGGIYRSDDGGKSWTKVNREHKLRQRAWYYSRIFADPQDENTVYALNTGFYKSVDGGKTFSSIAVPHGDNHGLWINPHHPKIMIQSNDGGANVSFNGGKSWSTQMNQPTSEFYRVSVDNQFPYRVYGAQQDNSTISIPSRSPGGITPKQHWYAVGGGESGHIAVDPRNPDIVYAGNYIGQITRLDRSKGHSRDIVAYPQMHDGTAPRDIKYRFQWNAPIRISPHNPDRIYHCSQYVHVSEDGGQTWEVISPDLTTNKDAYQDIPGGPIQHDHTGVELYTTIFAFEESPHEAGVLWTGSDDGLLYLSRNGGKDWQKITPPQMPSEATINTIDLSAHGKGRAIVTAYKYRENDFRPMIYLTDDYGKNWRSLADGNNGIPAGHFTRVVREDPNRKGLLYAGTEFGMYFSLDEGKKWKSFQLNLPIVPITDMLIKEKDLVVATQGRSFWILDDLSPLYEWHLAKATKEAYLFAPRDAYRTQIRGFRDDDAPERAPQSTLYFYLPGKKEDQLVRLLILDQAGKVRRTFSTKPDQEKKEESLKVEAGLNRFEWDMNYEKPEVQPNSFFSLAYTGGIKAPTGLHSLRLEVGDQTFDQRFAIKKDPRWTSSDADLQDQYLLGMQVKTLLNKSHSTIGDIRSIRADLENWVNKSKKSDSSEAIADRAKEIIAQLDELEAKLIQTQNESGQDPINYPSMLDDQIAYLYSIVNFSDAKPNAGAYQRYEDLEEALSVHMASLKHIKAVEVAQFEKMLGEKGVKMISW